jgi:hypothetical protein
MSLYETNNFLVPVCATGELVLFYPEMVLALIHSYPTIS